MSAGISSVGTVGGEVAGAEEVPELAITGPGVSTGQPRSGIIGRGGGQASAPERAPDLSRTPRAGAGPQVPTAVPTASAPNVPLLPNIPLPTLQIPTMPPSDTPTVAVPTLTPTRVPLPAGIVTLSFASDAGWRVYDSHSQTTSLGLAQVVCLRRTPTTIPINCPLQATSWDSSQTATWGASIGAAMWICAPGVTKATHVDPDKDYWFSQCFVLGGPPTSGTIEIASDGHAEVWVNDRFIDDVRGSNQVRTFDVTSYLNMGVNCFAFEGVNDQCYGCEYSSEPAGLLFRGTLSYTAN